jgi:hypothetical protein
MTAVQIVPDGAGGYTATVAGTPIRVDAYAAEPDENGRVLVSLVVAADQLTVGIPPARHADPTQERRNQPPPSTWGNPDVPDPRANIPGWQPPPLAADAGRGNPAGHRHAGERMQRILGRVGSWRAA